MPNPSIEALRADRDRLKKAGRLIEARAVERVSRPCWKLGNCTVKLSVNCGDDVA